MLYDVLNSYKNFLLGSRSLAPETVRTYYIRLDNLLQGQNPLEPIQNFDVSKVIQNLSNIKYKNHFSQSKNAFFYFCEFQHIHISDKDREKIYRLEQATKKKHRKLESIELAEVKSKIDKLKNEKLKLSYRTMFDTGLRVSELSQIKPQDCKINDDNISMSFIGKGGKQESTTINKNDDPELYQKLKKEIANTDKAKAIFYSAIYLQTTAKKLGFKCLDLRRAFAKKEYKKSKSKSEVQKKLRHTNIKNTNIYIKSKIKI